MATRPGAALFAWSFVFIFCWITYGILQEYLFKTLHFQYPLTIVIVHEGTLLFIPWLILRMSAQSRAANRSGIWTTLERLLDGDAVTSQEEQPEFASTARPPTRLYVFLAISELVMRGTINVGLAYVDFTTKSLFQSSRIIPVMLMGLAFGRTYSLVKYVVAILLSVSLFSFTKGDSQSANFQAIGVILMALSTGADAYRYNLKKELVSGLRRKKSEMFIHGSFWGLVMITPIVLLSGELFGAIPYFFSHPSILALILLLYVLAFGGAYGVLAVIQLSGPFFASIVQAVRTLASILLSFLLFTKPFTVSHAVGGLLFTVAIALNSYEDRRRAGERPRQK